jgi:glyoxylase-like metal-dependent hydrolase (beta-lactamase superfamily II)
MGVSASAKAHMGKILVDEDFVIFRPRVAYRMNANVVVIRTEVPVIVDTGTKGNPPIHTIMHTLAAHDISPRSVRYIVLTHGHQDHIQNLIQFQSKFMNAATICHHADFENIQFPFLLSREWEDAFFYYGIPHHVYYRYRLYYAVLSNFFYRTLQRPNRITATVFQEIRLKLGNDYIDLIPFPGHSRGHLVVRDCRKNLYVGDMVPFVPWIEPTSTALDAMIESVQRVLRFSDTEIKRIIRGHGDIRLPPSQWEVRRWVDEKVRYQLFLDTIYETLDRIPQILQTHPLTMQQLTSKIIPHYVRYSKIMARLFIPPAISWGIAYCLKLSNEGKINRQIKGNRVYWMT